MSDFWYGQAWQEIKEQPLSFLALQVKKLRLFINGYEIPNNQDIYLAGDFSPILAMLMSNSMIYFPYGVLAPLAIMGLLYSLRNWRTYLLIYLLLGSYLLSLMLFFVCARYRQPLIPLLILLAVYGLSRFIQHLKRREIGSVVLYVVVTSLLLLECNHDMLGLAPERVKAENHHLLGNAYLEQDQWVRAEKEFRKAIEADSTFAQGFNNLGLLLAQRGSSLEAAALFKRGIELDPATIETFFNLSTLYLESGDLNAALEILKRARQLHPLNDFVHLKLGMTYYEAGQLPEAIESIGQCLKLNPSNAVARQVLDQILRESRESSGN